MLNAAWALDAEYLYHSPRPSLSPANSTFTHPNPTLVPSNETCLLEVGFMYRVFIKYCVFSLKFCDFSELCQFCCRAGVLPAWCVYTH